MPNPDQLDELVARPVEGLNVEIKRWISPTQPEGIAKIVKGTFAIYNRNGGYFLIGFDDTTGQPHPDNIPADVHSDFHIDAIQAIVSKYASKQFEITIEFRERAGCEHPIIVIPSGVTTVVAAKRDLRVGTEPYLLREGDVYFRTLGANGIVSSARARPDDWVDMLSICFDNREADIARFVRRHLAGDLGGLRNFLREEQAMTPTVPTTRPIQKPMTFDSTLSSPQLESAKKKLSIQTTRILDEGKRRFDAAAAERSDLPTSAAELKYGRWNVALAIEPPSEEATPTKEWLSKLEAANPSLTGWPAWLVSSRFTDEKSRPYVTDGAWQTLIVSLGGWSAHLEFQRVSPRGEFFLSRILQDDLQQKQTGGAGKVFDPILMILRVTEVIIVGLAFAKALGWSSEGTKLGFEFEWTGLAGRTLKAWANPMTILPPWFGAAHDSTVRTFVEVPLDTSPTAVAPYVQRAVASLFAAFDGATISGPVIEEWVRRLVERKLG